jgi:hypothetical protein
MPSPIRHLVEYNRPQNRGEMPRRPTIIEHVIIGQNRQQPVYFDRFWDTASTSAEGPTNATS